MPIRQATPEETQAFYGKTAVIFGQKRPDSSKKNLQEDKKALQPAQQPKQQGI